MDSLGNTIRTLREKYNLSQSQLADLVGVNSRAVISNWEQGSNKPSIDSILTLCQVFECTPNYLLDYDERLTPAVQDEETGFLLELWKKLDEQDKYIVLETAIACADYKEYVHNNTSSKSSSNKECFIDKNHPDYVIMKARKQELKILKQKTNSSNEFIARYLSIKGFKVSIMDMMLMFSGGKVPSRELCDELFNIFEQWR